MGINKNDATSFEEMAQEQEAPVTAAPVESAPETKTEEPPVSSGNFVSEDNTETPKAE